MSRVEGLYCEDPGAFTRLYIDYLSEILRSLNSDEVKSFVDTLLDARERRAKIFFVGNGGSASTASHFANDLMIGTVSFKKPFRVFSLTDNTAVMTAIGNDYGFDEIFERQIRVLGEAGDVLVAISASGNSPNLVKAFDAAKEMDITTVSITAFDGGILRKKADQGIQVNTEMRDYGPAEDAHLILNHIVSNYLKELVRKNS